MTSYFSPNSYFTSYSTQPNGCSINRHVQTDWVLQQMILFFFSIRLSLLGYSTNGPNTIFDSYIIRLREKRERERTGNGATTAQFQTFLRKKSPPIQLKTCWKDTSVRFWSLCRIERQQQLWGGEGEVNLSSLTWQIKKDPKKYLIFSLFSFPFQNTIWRREERRQHRRKKKKKVLFGKQAAPLSRLNSLPSF